MKIYDLYQDTLFGQNYKAIAAKDANDAMEQCNELVGHGKTFLPDLQVDVYDRHGANGQAEHIGSVLLCSATEPKPTEV